ncbi:unnamed protein product [Rotaria socialis]
MPKVGEEEEENAVQLSLGDVYENKTFEWQHRILTDDSDYVIIWLDKSVNNDQSDDQYSYHQLGHVTNSIAVFTDENKCFDFINKFRPNEKQIFLIVSGSLGKDFVPIVNDVSYINSIYVFCAIKSRHEIWTKNYNKIKVVSDDIDDLCKYLKTDKEKYQLNQIKTHPFLKPSSKKFVLPYEFNVTVGLSKNRYDSDQPNDDIQISTESAEIPFGIEENSSLKNHIETQGQVESSQTVTPYTHRNQQMEFSDTEYTPKHKTATLLKATLLFTTIPLADLHLTAVYYKLIESRCTKSLR